MIEAGERHRIGPGARSSTSIASAGCRAIARRRSSSPSSPPRPDHAEDLVARDHVAGRNGGYDGDGGAGRPRHRRPCAASSSAKAAASSGAAPSAQPGRRHPDPGRAALDLDSEGQLVASVLSKKIGCRRHARRARHARRPDRQGAHPRGRGSRLADALVARRADVVRRSVRRSYRRLAAGRARHRPGARGARRARGPAATQPDAPPDLRDRRSIHLAAAALELGGVAAPGGGEALAERTLADGTAWRKFQRICDAQGGMRGRPARVTAIPVRPDTSGAWAPSTTGASPSSPSCAGAPDAKAAGLELHVRIGDPVWPEQPLFTLPRRFSRRTRLRPGIRRCQRRHRHRVGNIIRHAFVAVLTLHIAGSRRGPIRQP